LHNNQLTGNIPPELGKLKYLYNLYLDSNELSGPIPSSFGKLTSLNVLDLRHNNLSGSIPSSLGNCINLEYLVLSHNKLSGNIPSSFNKLTKLYSLKVGGNILSGKVPSFLGTLPLLKELNIRRNYYTFDGLEMLVQNNNLNRLNYEEQRTIDLHQTNNMLSVYAGGTLSNNTYKWFKDGVLVSTINGDSTFTPTGSGAYNVEVSNSIATKLRCIAIQ
jgi:Leucine-rich repeat (LRR) protein